MSFNEQIQRQEQLLNIYRKLWRNAPLIWRREQLTAMHSWDPEAFELFMEEPEAIPAAFKSESNPVPE